MTRRMLVGVALFAIAACDGGVALESLPAEAAGAICGVVESCFGRLADRANGGEQCRTDVEADFENGFLATLQAAIDAGTVTYDPSLGATCIEEQRALGCSIFLVAPPQACRDMFTGTVAVGGACSISEECAGDAYCADADCTADVPGTCTARKGTGTACESTDECQGGLVCENLVCRTPASTSGGACGGDSGLACPLDQICIGAMGSAPGTCTPITSVFAGARDEPCDIFEQELCTPDLSCAITGVEGTTPVMTCVALADAGGSCFLAVPDMCPLSEYCDADPTMGRLEGTCQPRPGAGQACAQTPAGVMCAVGLDCIDGTCRALQDNGGSCETGEECRSGICEGGTCAPYPICT